MPEVLKPKNLKEQFRSMALPSGVPWRLFWGSGLLFLLVLLIYAGFSLGYKPFLESRLSEVEQQLQDLTAAITIDDQEDFTRFYSQLANFNEILANHPLPSKLFPFLENITNRRVLYTNLDLQMKERKLSLEGAAASYGVLAEQLESYEQESAIESYTLNQSQFSEGVVRFKATLTLAEEILK